MAGEIKTYQKYNSFVEIRHRKPLADVLPRIRQLRETVSATALSPEAQAVVLQACNELVGSAGVLPGPAFTLHANVAQEIAALSDSDLPRYLHYRYRYEIYPQRKILDSFPPLLQIEPASICNYRCVFCYQTDSGLTNKANGHMGMMSLDLFKQIVDQAQGNCEALTLASRGEPLINPQIKEMLSYTRGKFLATKTNTNAWYLDEAKCHAILEADLNTLVFSADAAAEPQYSNFRVGGTLERVLKNITLFRDIRAKHYPKSRLITRVSGVKVPGTPDLTEMETFWGNLVDQVAFVTYNPWENAYEQPVNEVAIPCSDLWRRMFVWWDGRVNPCDVDYKSTLSMGRLSDSTLTGLWRSEAYMQLRENHLKNKRSAASPCNRCVVV
jgi:radical SAM protein with 4Fe4S-binding SPASM domain